MGKNLCGYHDGRSPKLRNALEKKPVSEWYSDADPGEHEVGFDPEAFGLVHEYLGELRVDKSF